MRRHGDRSKHASSTPQRLSTASCSPASGSMEPSNQMYMENLQHSRHHHNFFLRARPYRGELPTVADTPAKMESTSHEAFSFRTVPRQDKDEHRYQNSQQETTPHSHTSSSRQTGSGHGSRHGRPAEDEQAETMLSQYQKDFPPPSSWRRRTTPALPQPDNIGINPAFRIDFRTVQRDTFPNWPKTETDMERSSKTH
uniref:uncharacterized protein si:dkeyp-69c1.9 isoform X2 n=1 Tax=Doryrhamphus excisus TaxID=161450 RepID=UPI0025AEC879|nr:uncharacterized protein si:dkeyp-69c1.9 isoform X2 [Doryrhamphus excisus]